MSIHLQTRRTDALSKAFAQAATELKYRTRRDHHLFILSCYIDFDAIKKLISGVKGKVRLTRADLAFEYLEAFRRRLPNETISELQGLEGWCKRQDVKFRWHAVRAGALMHAKAYAVVQLGQSEPQQGMVCITSGNATPPGLGITSKRATPNIELAYMSGDDVDVSSFKKVWRTVCKSSRSLDEAGKREDAYEFAYSLLASGVFLHDWRDNLRSQVGIVYTLTPEGQKAITLDEELRLLGFSVDQATINRNPLSTVNFSGFRVLPQGFTAKYTVDSIIGRWCPRSVWEVVEETVERDEGFKAFLKAFRENTMPRKLESLVEQEEKIADRLAERGFVTTDAHRVERWKAKVELLRENKERLARIFIRFAPFDLPYDYQAREDVEELHDSLLESLAISHNMSLAKRKIKAAEGTGNLSALELTEYEKDQLGDELAAVRATPRRSR